MPRAQKPFDNYVERTDSCWLWRGAATSTGYGSYRYGGKPRKAHHVAYLKAHGSLPESGPGLQGFVVMHTCDNRLCVNPNHLKLGTQAQNIADRQAKGRQATRATKNRWNKITAEDAAKIKEARTLGTKLRELAGFYGVSIGGIQRVLRSNGSALPSR